MSVPPRRQFIRLEHSWTRSVVVLHLPRHFCMTTKIISREMSNYRRIGIFLVRLPPQGALERTIEMARLQGD